MERTRFIYDVPDKNADLYYATRFQCCDPVIFFERGGRKFMVMSALEVDRAKSQARADDVLPLTRYTEKAAKKSASPKLTDVLKEIFDEHGICEIEVPKETSFTLVDELRALGLKIEAGESPFFPERLQKTKDELKFIADAQKVTYSAIAMVRDVLKKGKIKGNKIFFLGKALTSESLRGMADVFLAEKGFETSDTIISSGKHALDPHDVGTGPIAPNTSVIVDIFPRSKKTRFYGDATRTFCKGHAPDALKKMYAVVKEAQEDAIGRVKGGADGKKVYTDTVQFFTDRGYKTGENRGRQEGFFHGLGHSIGLEIHEEPLRMNQKGLPLKKGNVMSVEPGLYYEGIGGVRIEDLVHVTDTGCDILGKFPKQLEIL